jgi:HK97 family phage prohead protease
MQKNIDLIKEQQMKAKENLQKFFARVEVKEFIEKINADDTPEMEFKVIATNMAVDRDKEIVDVNGWDLENFMKNPVILWGHDLKSLPIGVALKVYRQGDDLIVEGKFASKEGNPIADNVRNLYKEKIIRTVSVGFIGREYTYVKSKDGKEDLLKWTKQELYELSFVPVPSNPEALSLMKSKGMSDDQIAQLVETEKGEVADEVNQEDTYAKKREMFSDVSTVFYALSEIYFDETTPVTDFAKLLNEAVGLLTKIANGEDVSTSDDNTEGKLLDLNKCAKIIKISNSLNDISQLKELIENIAFDVKEIKASRGEEKATLSDDAKADEKKEFTLAKFLSKETLQELNKLTNKSLSELNKK